MRKIAAFAAGFLAAAFAGLQPNEAASQIKNYEAEGNLEATQPLGCVDLGALTNVHTPADIFPGVRKCIEAGEYGKAADLFAVAGVYGRFDMLRVVDQTAHQAIAALQINTLGSIDQARVAAFQESVQGHYHAGSDDLVRICGHLKEMGPPAYEPVYMLQHGLSVFTGEGGGLKADFNPTEAWSEALDGYLHCPQ